MQADSLPAESQGKPKNTGMGSLSLLQGNLPDPGIKPGSPALQADSLPTIREAHELLCVKSPNTLLNNYIKFYTQ